MEWGIWQRANGEDCMCMCCLPENTTRDSNVKNMELL